MKFFFIPKWNTQLYGIQNEENQNWRKYCCCDFILSGWATEFQQKSMCFLFKRLYTNALKTAKLKSLYLQTLSTIWIISFSKFLRDCQRLLWCTSFKDSFLLNNLFTSCCSTLAHLYLLLYKHYFLILTECCIASAFQILIRLMEIQYSS